MNKEQNKKVEAMKKIFDELSKDNEITREVYYCTVIAMQATGQKEPKSEEVQKLVSFGFSLITALLHNKKIMLIK